MSRWLCLVLLAFVGGCSEYAQDYRYAPRPAVAEIPATQPQDPPRVSALASVIGIHYEDRGAGIPFSVEARLQLTNDSAQTVVFDPTSLQLTTGSLVTFSPPLMRPPQPFALAPGQSATVEAYFPFPPGQDLNRTDLDSLQLRWRVQMDGNRMGQAVNFRRVYSYYYDDGPYWGPYPYVGGVVVIHRR
jgi:hypothetical protein